MKARQWKSLLKVILQPPLLRTGGKLGQLLLTATGLEWLVSLASQRTGLRLTTASTFWPDNSFCSFEYTATVLIAGKILVLFEFEWKIQTEILRLHTHVYCWAEATVIGVTANINSPTLLGRTGKKYILVEESTVTSGATTFYSTLGVCVLERVEVGSGFNLRTANSIIWREVRNWMRYVQRHLLSFLQLFG